MLIKRGGDIKGGEITDQALYLNRRAFMAGAAALALAPGVAAPGMAAAAPPAAGQPLAATRNKAFDIPDAATKFQDATTYNNFYEFGSQKSIASEAQALKIRPWTINIDGLVEKPVTVDIDDLMKKMPLEERLYRHRCVEAWSMAVPWSGFPMAAFVDFAKPLGSAKYVQMETFLDPKTASGQKQVWYPWPYVEGVTIAEAGNELAFLVTGMYGKPVPKQDGAPLRLALPWKYGFKSVKSIVRFSFTDKRPVSFWEALAANEYGFWANVNPAVPHPRWSQADERVLGTNERRPTLKWNGYGEFVAHLYDGIENERLFV